MGGAEGGGQGGRGEAEGDLRTNTMKGRSEKMIKRKR